MKKHGKEILAKLRGRAGESISETLVALLVAALALVMLAGAVSSGSNVINRSRQKLRTYYDINEKITKRISTADTHYATGSAPLSIKSSEPMDDSLKKQSIIVQYYKNDEFADAPVVAYKRPKA
ncbi:MAG: hypothetical protein IJT29_03230 [Oscillospiraceae bacterium]|nr:hypothetical protein [Oscillospiraceae bacterium]